MAIRRRAGVFVAADPQHLAGKIDADDAPGARRPVRWPPGRDPQCPCTESSTVSRAGELQRRDRARTPSAVEAGAEHMIQQIVPAGDRVKHPGDTGGFLRWRERLGLKARGLRDCPRRTDAAVTMKYRMPT